jgi:Mn-containing catalase
LRAAVALFARLKNLFALHLEETEHQVQRIEECFKELGVAARAKPCKGMMGIIEEGEEVMRLVKVRAPVSAPVGGDPC